MTLQQRSAIVVVVDRLGAGFLGPYGNTWLETPEFNRLASQSCLFEQVLADSARLESCCRSYWRGLHAMGMREDEVTGPSLPGMASGENLAATLITDEPVVADHPLAAGFRERVVLAPREAETAAEDLEQTELAQILAAACDFISQAEHPFLLWVHARGMVGPWDASPAFRRQFASADDPEPPQFVTPPSLWLAAADDPDIAWGFTQAYAGQVALLDLGLGMLLDALDGASEHQETLFALTSPRGFPLGEHQRVGAAEDGLYGELLHVPLFIRLPDTAGARQRSQALVQPPDLFATFAEWLGLPFEPTSTWGRSLLPIISGQCNSLRQRACAVLNSERAIRTPAWFMRRSAEAHNLYVKPDDRWEVNEVSVRCPDVVDGLSAALDEFEQAAQAPPFDDLPPLPVVLAEGLD